MRWADLQMSRAGAQTRFSASLSGDTRESSSHNRNRNRIMPEVNDLDIVSFTQAEP